MSMERCPKCGGTTGAYFKEWQAVHCLFTWSGQPDGGETGSSMGGSMMYCRDCGEAVCRASTFFNGKGGGE